MIELVHLRKMRLGEAARLLGKTPNSTSVLLHRTLAKLSKLLQKER